MVLRLSKLQLELIRIVIDKTKRWFTLGIDNQRNGLETQAKTARQRDTFYFEPCNFTLNPL